MNRKICFLCAFLTFLSSCLLAEEDQLFLDQCLPTEISSECIEDELIRQDVLGDSIPDVYFAMDEEQEEDHVNEVIMENSFVDALDEDFQFSELDRVNVEQSFDTLDNELSPWSYVDEHDHQPETHFEMTAKKNKSIRKQPSLDMFGKMQTTFYPFKKENLAIEDLADLAISKDFFCEECPSHHVKNSNVPEEAWNAVYPYLLPEHYPIKAKLDEIFGASRVTQCKETVGLAGFNLTKQQGGHIIATKHKKLKGAVIKMYLDFQVDQDGWQKWVNRVEGANLIRSTLKTLGLQKQFKVPKKWIYQLPENPPPVDEKYRHNHFILVVEDMDLLPPGENHAKYRLEATHELLDQIYVISEMLGLYDTPRASNLAWTKSGKLAFVDTESYYRWPVMYHPLVEHLSPNMRPYWKKITKYYQRKKQAA